MLRVLDEDVWVVHRIVVIIKLHDASHERIVSVGTIFQISFFVILYRHHDRLLEQMSRLHYRVGEKFSKVLHLLNSREFCVHFGTCLDVRVPCAVVDRVTNLFAACAADVLLRLCLIALLFVIHIFFFIVFGLVLAVLASRLILGRLTAAPPHLATVVALMHTTTPIVILFIVEFFATVFACLEATVKLAFTLDEFLYAQLGLLLVHGKLLASLLERQDLVLDVIELLVDPCQLLGEFYLTLLARGLVKLVLLLQHAFVAVDFREVSLERVSLLDQSRYLFAHIPNLSR